MIVGDYLLLWNGRVFVIHGCSFSVTMMNDTLTEHDMLHSCVLKYFLPIRLQAEDELKEQA